MGEPPSQFGLIAQTQRIGRHEDERKTAHLLLKLLGQLHAVAVGQAQIDQAESRPLLAGALQRLSDTAGFHHSVAVARQHPTKHLAEHFVVIDQQDGRGGHESISCTVGVGVP